MEDTELLAETNALLRELLKLEEQYRLEASDQTAKTNEVISRARADAEQRMREDLLKHGLPEEAADPSEDFDARMRAVQDRARENMEELKRTEHEFRDELLSELRKQGELLEQIAKRLGVEQ